MACRCRPGCRRRRYRSRAIPLRVSATPCSAGTIATGAASIEDVGWQLFHLMLDVASGRKTWAEHWKLTNARTLFNRRGDLSNT